MSAGRVVVVLVGLVVLLAVVTNNRSDSRADPRAPAATVEANWIPAGFLRSPESSVAYRWIDGQTCLLDSCWGIEAIARDGCPSSLYIELSIEDTAGTAVGYTNDTVSSLKAGQRAKFTFENSEDTGQKARVTKVSCY